MTRQIIYINWNYIGDSVLTFITLVFMLFSYSMAYGLIAYATSSYPFIKNNAGCVCSGLISYVAPNRLIYLTRKISQSFTKDRKPFNPAGFDEVEYWACESSPVRLLPKRHLVLTSIRRQARRWPTILVHPRRLLPWPFLNTRESLLWKEVMSQCY